MKSYSEKENRPSVVECLECGTPFYGRPDKKFCCLTCKNRYHNSIRSESNGYRNRTIRLLDNNYRILSNLLALGTKSAAIADLVSVGFNTEVQTCSIQYKRGRSVNRCYDIQYTQTALRISDLEKI